MKTLCGLLIVFYLLVFLNGGVEGNVELYDVLGLSQEGLVRGRVWQLVSYGMLHAHWAHVLLNVTFLYFLGSRLQKGLGLRVALLVTFAGVVVGGLMHLLVGSFSVEHPKTLLVGVSGGLMAVLLCLTTVFPYVKMRPLRVRSKYLGLGFLLSFLLFTLMTPSLNVLGFSVLGGWLSQVLGESFFQIAHACHLGGGVAGWLIGRRFVIFR